MTDMVERVAKAIYDSCSLQWQRITWDERNHTEWLKQARAAIRAMREPTEHECIDEHGSDRWDWTCGVCGGPKENWERIIDSALKENPNETN